MKQMMNHTANLTCGDYFKIALCSINKAQVTVYICIAVAKGSLSCDAVFTSGAKHVAFV